MTKINTSKTQNFIKHQNYLHQLFFSPHNLTGEVTTVNFILSPITSQITPADYYL